MSLVEAVVKAVLKRGQASVDDIAHGFPDHTRDQLVKALRNAGDRNILIRVIKGSGNPKKGCGRPPVWGQAAAKSGKPTVLKVPRVASVFELGLGNWLPEDWPLPCENARIHVLADDEETV